MRKAARFQLQVALASSLDDPRPAATGVTLGSAAHPPPLVARVGKTYSPPSGRRALELAMRKAARFRVQVASEFPVAPTLDDASPDATEVSSPRSAAAQVVSRPSGGRSSSSVLRPSRAKEALSSPRGQRALELAMRKAAEALAASAPFPTAVPAIVAPASSSPRRFVPFRKQFGKWTVFSQALLAVGLVSGIAWFLHHHRESQAVALLARPRPSLEWLHEAQDRAEDGSFRLALKVVDRALADSPDNAALLKLKGDMNESLLQFGDAQTAYEQALRIDPHSRWARENLVLSRRLSRVAGQSAGRLSTLYGLHRAMLTQGRLGEAVAISNRLRSDPKLGQLTWQAALDRTGLHGRVTVDGEGGMSLDLSGTAQPDLTLIQKFPVRHLYLAGTGLDDLLPLRGMPLETLDLSDTPVHDLAPLRGMPLAVLRIAHTGVVDLTPLEDCALRELDISGTRVAGVEALARMPLASLQANGTLVADLHPLAALPLVRLSLSYTRVKDLRPLQHLGLEELILEGTNVSDITALRGCPLRELSLAHTPVEDLAPLADAPLTVLMLQGCPNVKDLRPLLSCNELEHLYLPPDLDHLEALHKLPHLRFIEEDDSAPGRSPALSATRNDSRPRR